MKHKKPIIIAAIVLCIILMAIVVFVIWNPFAAKKSDETSKKKITVKKNQEDSSKINIKGSEVIDPGVFSSVPIIAVDSKNNPHVISYETTNEDLLYSTKVRGKWESEAVDTEGNVGDGHDIAIDQDGNPHISYRDITSGSVKYARKTGGSWKTETLDVPPEGDKIDCSSIAIDSNGNPHVAYFVSKAAELRYASWDGSSWNIETPGISGQFIDLALGPDGNPHIVALTNPESESEMPQVKHVTKLSNGKWEEEVVDSQTPVRYDPRIAVDSKGYPHLAYRDASTSFVKHTSWDGTSWVIQTVEEDAEETGAISAGSQMDLALDKNDNPHIVIARPGKGLVLAITENGKWSYEVVGPSRVCTIAVDQLDRNHIAHTADAESGQDNDKDDEQTDDGEVQGQRVGTTDNGEGEGQQTDGDDSQSPEIIKYILVK